MFRAYLLFVLKFTSMEILLVNGVTYLLTKTEISVTFSVVVVGTEKRRPAS